jgi:hypothetical protein
MTADQPEILLHPVDPDLGATKWIVLGASVQGTSHLKIDLPCQDAHAYRVLSDSVIIAAVADGLGSAIYSGVGSQLAVSSAIDYLAQELRKAVPEEESAWTQLVRDGFLAAASRLEAEAQKDQAALRDYSTTLIVAVLTSDWLATGQIGDGAVVASLQDGGLVLISLPQNEEYVNVTYPLTMPDMANIAEFKACEAKVNALALMSDGMQHVSIRTLDHTPHQPFFEPLFRQLPGVKEQHKASRNLAEFMASERVCAHTDDDKTLVLIGRQRT